MRRRLFCMPGQVATIVAILPDIEELLDAASEVVDILQRSIGGEDRMPRLAVDDASIGQIKQ